MWRVRKRTKRKEIIVSMKEKDPYKILKMEFEGIKDVIMQYTSDGLIGNYLKTLEKAISNNIPSELLYSLEHICLWYKENMTKINSNEWVFNKHEHVKVKELLESLNEQLQDYDFSCVAENRNRDTVVGNQVFIVHGHDNEAKITVARTIEQLGMEAIILHEQPDEGKTIIEKLESFTSEAAYAIVLYTECDIGRTKGKSEKDNKFRARQNVVFEHGLFIGSLGRQNVCALVKGNVEKPGDIDGIVYIQMDNAGAWKLQLCSNMKAAGFDIDMNKLI